MLTTTTSIADALFTKTQKRVLTLLFSDTEQSYYLNELVRLAGVGKGTVRRELDNLLSAEIITITKQGNQNHYRANPKCPVFNELKSIIKKTSGILDVLLHALEPFLNELELAFVYGSVAKGSEHSASDIDLMLVGEGLNYSDIIGELIPAAEQLGREVNPTIFGPKELKERLASKQSFATRVLAQDKLWLLGENNLENYQIKE
jgi:uncharacterized protein